MMHWGWCCKEGRLKILKMCLHMIRLSKSEKLSNKSKLLNRPRRTKINWLWRKLWISSHKVSFISRVWRFHQQESNGSITYKKWKTKWKICARNKNLKRQFKIYSHFETTKFIWNLMISFKMSLLSFSIYKPICLEIIMFHMRHNTYSRNWLRFKALIHNFKRRYKKWERVLRKKLQWMKFSIQIPWKRSNCRLKRGYMILLKRSKPSVTRTSRK